MKNKTIKKKYKSQAAQDAQRRNYGDANYWQYLDDAAEAHGNFFKEHGQEELAKKQFTQSLGEALQGNDGD